MDNQWYWVKFRGEKMWACPMPDTTYFCIVGSDDLIDKEELEILAGPLKERDIDNAYFDYWV